DRRHLASARRDQVPPRLDRTTPTTTTETKGIDHGHRSRDQTARAPGRRRLQRRRPPQDGKHWTDNGLNINPFGDRFQGRTNIEADLREGLAGFMEGSQHKLAVSHVASLNQRTAVADGMAPITGIVGFNGKTMEPLASSFSMICTRDQDGHWHIAQMRAYRFIPKQG